MINFLKKFESNEKSKDTYQEEIIQENELPQYVKDEIEKIKIKYGSASNDGLFRIVDCRKISLDEDRTHYLINGSISIHAPSSLSGKNYVGSRDVQFIIEVQDGKVLKTEKKVKEELLAA